MQIGGQGKGQGFPTRYDWRILSDGQQHRHAAQVVDQPTLRDRRIGGDGTGAPGGGIERYRLTPNPAGNRYGPPPFRCGHSIIGTVRLKACDEISVRS